MKVAYVRSGLRWHRGCVKDVLSTPLFNAFFTAILLVAQEERYSKDGDILADLAHLQEQLLKVGPETAIECARHVGDAVCFRRVYRVVDTARVGADGGGLGRSLRYIWSEHL